MAQGKLTDKQIEKLRKLEDFRAAKGLDGYEDFFESILASLLENEGLTEDDLDNFQTEQKNTATHESFNELLDIRRYEYVNESFTERNWPLEPVEPDEDEWVVVEHHFERVMTVDQGLIRLQEMKNNGEIRLLTGSRRALKWIAEHPDEQMKHPIILPLCGALFFGLRVPFFGHGKIWGGTGPRLHLYSPHELVAPAHRWLVLRKKTAVITTQESFADLLAACNLVNSAGARFNETDWPLEPVEPDENDWEISLHHFPDPVTLQQGFYRLRQMEAKGEIKLLTGSRRAMKWIADNPNAQEDYPIIFPLCGQERPGAFPVFHCDFDDYNRSLTLHHFVDDIGQDCRWLVLRRLSPF